VVVERAVTWLHVFQGFGTRVYPWQPGLICGLLYGGIVVEGRSPDELAVNVQCVLIEITKRQKRS